MMERVSEFRLTTFKRLIVVIPTRLVSDTLLL